MGRGILRNPTPRLATLSMGIAVLVTAILGVGYAAVSLGTATTGHDELIVLAGGFTALTLAPFAIARLRGVPVNFAEPIYIIAILFFFYFPFRTFYLLANPSAVNVGLGPRPYSDALPGALVAAAVVFLSTCVGYYISVGHSVAHRLPRIADRFSDDRYVLRAVCVSGLGLATWLYLLYVVGRSHGLNDSYNGAASENLTIQVSQFTVYGTALLASFALRKGGATAWLGLGAAVAINCYIAFAEVIRIELVVAALSFGLAFHFFRRRVTVRWVSIGIVLVLGVFVPVVGTERILSETGKTTANPLVNAANATTTLASGGPGQYFSRTMSILGGRLHGVDSVAATLKYTPQVRGYQYGREYLLFVPPLTYVPRVIWPGKPSVFNEQFGPTYFGRTQFTQTHIAMTEVSDLYYNFWWPGLVAGGLFLGILYRVAYTYFIDRPGPNPVGVFVYTFVLVQFMLIELEIATPLSQIVRALPFLLMIVWFMRVRGRPSTPELI